MGGKTSPQHGYEVGLAHGSIGDAPMIYLTLSEPSGMSLMSPAQARAMAKRIRKRCPNISDKQALLDLASTLDELAAEVESGAWR